MKKISFFTRNLLPWLLKNCSFPYNVPKLALARFRDPWKTTTIRVRGMTITIFCGGAGLTDIFVMQIYNVPLSKDQPIIFDGGANAGLFTLWADQKWKNARIYAYEPVGYNYEVAKSNIEKYAPSQIVYKKALSTCVGKAALNIGVHPGSSSLIKTEIGSSQQQEVETTTLTEEMDLHDIHYVDLLKLDVEGSEIDILRGANLARVGFIAMEYHYRDGGKLIDDILERTHKKILHKEGIMWYQPIGSYSKTFA